MLTTNRAYETEFYRHPSQSMSYVLRNHTLGDVYGSPTYSSNRDTPVPEFEGKPISTHRKRVPVACERCRKRKIKCSGDQGDGSGCDNCKNAGHDGCQFLRVLSRPLQQYSQPHSTARNNAYHYHPYSRPNHALQIQQAHQAREYVQQPSLPYDAWQSSIEYSTLPTATSTNMAWNQTTYPTAYQMYEAEHTSPYSAQTPTYMLPDPGHVARSDLNYVASLPRAQHTQQIWLDSTNSTPNLHQNAQMVSPVYPLTPDESIKSHSLLNQPAMITITSERALPIPSLAAVQQTLPSQGRETPPLSAASHRSSYTWTTDSASNISAVSSRTSCGGSQDFTATANPYHACEEHAPGYPYETDSTGSLLDGTLTSMPVTAGEGGQHSELHQMPRTTSSHGKELASLRARASLDSLKASSPSLYRQSIRPTSRRSHGMYPPRLMTSFSGGSIPSSWMPSPSTASPRHDSALSQTMTHPLSGSSDDYSDDQAQVPDSLLGPRY